MKVTRMRLVAVPIFCVAGVIALSLFMISSTAAAPKTISLSNNMMDRWHILADMDEGRGDPGVVVVNEKIHVISGYWSPGYNYVYSQEVYDPLTATWQYLASPPVPRSDFVAVNFRGKIYAIGGWNFDPNYEFDGVVDQNHVYDPQTDTWDTMKQPLPIPVSGAGGVILNDKIHIIGGYTSDLLKTNIVQIYDPISDTWSKGTPMNSVRSELGAVVLNGLIYAIGGQEANNLIDVEIFNPVSNSWTEGPALPERRSSMAVAVRQGKIYVIGGFYNELTNVKDTMFVYDPETNSWSSGPPMPTARSACRGAVVSDSIYVIGGAGVLGAGEANEVYGSYPSPLYLPLVRR
jgi:hypothetical protein